MSEATLSLDRPAAEAEPEVPVSRQSRVGLNLANFFLAEATGVFVPLLGALALGLAGHTALHRLMGENQGFNHAGNIAAALTAIALVGWFGTASVFYAVAAVSVLAAASVLVIRPDDLREEARRPV